MFSFVQSLSSRTLYILFFMVVTVPRIEQLITTNMAESSTIPVRDSQQLLVKICHPWTWRIANVFMAVFFSLAAYVQVSEWFVC